MNIEKDIENLNKYIFLIEKDYCDECNELNVISYGKHCNGSRNTANSIKNVLSELEKKDKMINIMADLMAHKIGTRTHICQNMKCDKNIAKECKSCVIEWVENEVK